MSTRKRKWQNVRWGREGRHVFVSGLIFFDWRVKQGFMFKYKFKIKKEKKRKTNFEVPKLRFIIMILYYKTFCYPIDWWRPNFRPNLESQYSIYLVMFLCLHGTSLVFSFCKDPWKMCWRLLRHKKVDKIRVGWYRLVLVVYQYLPKLIW